MNFLSRNIKHLRLINNLTQEDVAKIVNKARSLVSAWESDDRDITTEDIIKLSDYFDVSMDSLIGKDLSLKNNDTDELDILYNKYKHLLNEDDKETIKFIIEKRKKEKELKEE